MLSYLEIEEIVFGLHTTGPLVIKIRTIEQSMTMLIQHVDEPPSEPETRTQMKFKSCDVTKLIILTKDKLIEAYSRLLKIKSIAIINTMNTFTSHLVRKLIH
jgi:hypothetical protein